jgi:hypothetical protein
MSTVTKENANVGSMDIGADGIALIGKICRGGLTIRQNALAFLQILKTKGLIKESDSWAILQSNQPLLDMFQAQLAVALPIDKTKSDFGNSIVSSFDLYFNGRTNGMLDALLDAVGVELTHQELFLLRASRDRLFEFILELRYMMMINFDLCGTPNGVVLPRSAAVPPGKKAKMTTKKDVAHKVAQAEKVDIIFYFYLSCIY